MLIENSRLENDLIFDHGSLIIGYWSLIIGH